MAQPSIGIKYFEYAPLHHIIDDKQYDEPLQCTYGEVECVCFNDYDYECNKCTYSDENDKDNVSVVFFLNVH